MARFAILALAVLVSTCVLPFASTAQEPAANAEGSGVRLADLLPTTDDVAPGLLVVEEGARSAEEVAATFLEPAEAAARLVEWGWQENAYRDFAAPGAGAGQRGIASLQASLHRFRTAAGARRALAYFAATRSEALGHRPVRVERIGEQTRAIRGPVEGGTEATVYARRGGVLARVSAVVPNGDPLADALALAGVVVAKAGGALPPTSPDRAAVPVAADAEDCLSSGHALSITIIAGVLPFEQAAETFGCRLLPNGRWVVAGVGDASEFVRPIPPDPVWEPFIEQGRRALLDDVRGLAAYPLITRFLVYDLDAQTVRLVSGNRVEVVELRGRSLLYGLGQPYHDLYQRAAAPFVRDPNHVRLAGYVQWYANRRDAALDALTFNLHPLSAQGLRGSLGYGTIPWPWQLADPYTVDTYLIYVAETTGGVAPNAAVPEARVPEATADDECEGVVEWWNATMERAQTWDAFVVMFDDSRLPTEETLRGYGDAFMTMAQAQRQSRPPPAAEELNTALVRISEGTASARIDYAALTVGQHPLIAQVLPGRAAGSLFQARRDYLFRLSDLLPALIARCPS